MKLHGRSVLQISKNAQKTMTKLAITLKQRIKIQ
jgi:hypothetical protein